MKDQKPRVVCAQCGLADGIHEMDCKPPMKTTDTGSVPRITSAPIFKLGETTVRYLPMIARTNDPVVRRFIDTGKGKKAASVKRVWSVYDTTTDEWMPQPSVHAGWQTRAGCQRTCDKLNK